MKIMCNFELKKKDVEDKFGIHFDEVFAYELGKMKPYVHHDLVELYPDRLVVLPKGKIFVRAVAMQFDRYLRVKSRRRLFAHCLTHRSKTSDMNHWAFGIKPNAQSFTHRPVRRKILSGQ